MTNDPLSAKHCVPCEGGVDPLTRAEFSVYLPQLSDWSVAENDTRIGRTIERADFQSVLELTNAIGALAESEGHHPDLHIHDYNKLSISLTTHAIGGLSINDFVLASKIDQLAR